MWQQPSFLVQFMFIGTSLNDVVEKRRAVAIPLGRYVLDAVEQRQSSKSNSRLRAYLGSRGEESSVSSPACKSYVDIVGAILWNKILNAESPKSDNRRWSRGNHWEEICAKPSAT